MEMIIGALFGVGLFLMLSISLYIGYRIGRFKLKPPDIKVDEDVLREQKEIEKDFKNLMSYDLDKALQRKKVTE